MNLWGSYKLPEEQFFIHKDGSPVLASQFRHVLKNLISGINLDPSLYGTHSLRAGRSCDLIKFGYTIEEVKCIGRWLSNAIYRYLS